MHVLEAAVGWICSNFGLVGLNYVIYSDDEKNLLSCNPCFLDINLCNRDMIDIFYNLLAFVCFTSLYILFNYLAANTNPNHDDHYSINSYNNPDTQISYLIHLYNYHNHHNPKTIILNQVTIISSINFHNS